MQKGYVASTQEEFIVTGKLETLERPPWIERASNPSMIHATITWADNQNLFKIININNNNNKQLFIYIIISFFVFLYTLLHFQPQ